MLIRRPGKVFATAWEKIRERTGTPDLDLKTLPSLSTALYGIHRAEMMVLGARTSQGKTALAMQIAYDLALQSKKVYYFSLEMSSEALMERLFCQAHKIGNRCLYETPEKYQAEAENFCNTLHDVPLIVAYNVGWSINELWKIINDLEKPDVVIIDYVQMIRGFETDRISALAQYTIAFREMCVKHNFAGILLSQVNRGAMEDASRRPNLWLLKGSGALEETADTCLLLHWDFFYSGKNENKFEVYIAKQRNGRVGKVNLVFTPEHYRFEEPAVIPPNLLNKVKGVFGGKEVSTDEE